MQETLILNHQEISFKLDRIAWQILEQHYNEERLVLVGLAENGTDIAKKLETCISKFRDIKVITITLSLDKRTPLTSKVEVLNSEALSNSAVILVDDVLNSGITMAAALKEILNHNPKSVRTAVLANRDHHKFPIQANYVGISLATTLQEHISYSEKEGEMTICLR